MSNFKNTWIPTCLIAFLFLSCNGGGVKTGAGTQEGFQDSFLGLYATESYAQRDEGYDWVTIRFEHGTDSTYYINVESRMDKKEPTCSYSGIGKGTAADKLTAHTAAGSLDFNFAPGSVTIEASSIQDEPALYYFCSGGGSLANTYYLLEED